MGVINLVDRDRFFATAPKTNKEECIKFFDKFFAYLRKKDRSYRSPSKIVIALGKYSMYTLNSSRQPS